MKTAEEIAREYDELGFYEPAELWWEIALILDAPHQYRGYSHCQKCAETLKREYVKKLDQ